MHLDVINNNIISNLGQIMEPIDLLQWGILYLQLSC